MRSRRHGDRIRKLSENPSLFLALCGLRKALKKSAQPIRHGFSGFVIFIVPPGYRTDDYKTAAYTVIGADAEDWLERDVRVRAVKPVGKKGTLDGPMTIFDLKGLSILIADNIDEVPKDVCFAALDVLHVQPPSEAHIQGVRRLSGRAPLSDEHAAVLARKPQNVVLAAVGKKALGAAEIAELEEMELPINDGPNLCYLPGYQDVKLWAERLRADIALWKDGKLSWKEVSGNALFVGPPGTGKTFFASALANALGLRLISTTIGTWQATGHLDDVLSAMRRTFDDANDGRGAVIFIDEFDSIGVRSSKPASRDQYWQIVVNEFLSLMSNLRPGVMIVGATNLQEAIDPAILRAGRMERRFAFSLPDKCGRAEILRYYVGGRLDFESLSEIAEDLEGKSGADLERLVRDARAAARRENRELEPRDLLAELPERISYTPEQMLRLAVHEAGHALTALSVGYAWSATIEIKADFDPSAAAYLGGKTSYELVEDHLPTETSLRNRIAVGIAGMAAEAAVLHERSIGSGGVVGSDLERATSIARRMVGSYGFGTRPVFLGTVEALETNSLPESLEREAFEIVDGQYKRVLAMLTEKRERLVELAADIVVHRTLRIERSGRADAA